MNPMGMNQMVNPHVIEQLTLVHELVKLRGQLQEVDSLVKHYGPISQKEMNLARVLVDDWILAVIKSMATAAPKL